MNIALQILSFLSAFLLFYLELLISKSLLPVLGGASFVWVSCVTFFTLVMLLSNWIFKIIFEKFGDKFTFVTFFILSLAGIFSFPFNIPKEPQGEEILFIFSTLFKNIGLPFFILSAASPVIQKFSFNLLPQKNPYVLYGISNWGSLLALLLFPLFFEPLFLTSEKYLITYILYGIFIITFGVILITQKNLVSNFKNEENGFLKMSWVFLSASTTAFFLATTNFITYDIGSAPLFWALPLGLFLLSYILNFKEQPWRPKYSIYVFIVVVFVLEIFFKSFLTQILFHYTLLFFACFKINQILFNSRPPERFLPGFYFSLSLGGLIGSFGILFAGPTLFKHNKLLSADFLLVLLFILLGFWFHLERFKTKRILATLTCLGIVIFYIFGFFKNPDEYIFRNFYGIYRIKTRENFKSLLNGTTLHGSQDLTNPHKPLAYYGYKSPIGLLLRWKEFKNIASVGLGIGNLLSYGNSNQTWDIIEIDPDAIDLAKNHFSYIKNCPAKINFLVGDGRIILSKQPPGKYDLIIIDAFTGDNIPFHLLSIEAFKIYLDKLKEGGIIAFHISNRYHDFSPLLKSTANSLWVHFLQQQTQSKNQEKGIRDSNWAFMIKALAPKDPLKLKPVPWTDSYYNFWDTLKLFR